MMTLQLPLRPREGGLWYTRVSEVHVCDMPRCMAQARYDARLPSGQWAWVCEQHALIYQVRLGLGRGQLLLSPDEEVPE